MKFNFEYRTRDNVRHSGSLCASDREAAFAALRRQGVKPAVLVEAPGLFNKVLGKGKRWIAIVVLAGVAAVSLYMATENRTGNLLSADSLPRHQLYGDPALIEELERSDFASVFPTEAERILAWFARPGLAHSFADREWERKLADGIPAALAAETSVLPDDFREAAELKLIVKGMKDEIRRYLANGVGTPTTYVRRLRERQFREIQIYTRAVEDLKREKNHSRREHINASLRAMGLKTVPLYDLEEEKGDDKPNPPGT